MKLPEPIHTHSTASAILKKYESQSQEQRPHLGASEIGKPCERAIWYGYRWSTAKKFEGRILRLFNTGHREETRFLEELKSIGAEVYDRDPETGKQHSFSAFGGHFAGSCDAIARGLPEAPKTWAVVEFKTHSSKSFKELSEKGVEQAKPEHFVQMQIYMGLAELDRALYLAVNKDTDELYSEWIKFDKDCFDYHIAKADRIIRSITEPQKLSNEPSWYQCKFCDHQAVCHRGHVPLKSCRTCTFATPKEDGTWHCDYFKRTLSVADQRHGCRSHLFIPNLVSFAEPIDTGNGWVAYQDKKTKVVFANVTEDCDRGEDNMPSTSIIACYTSKELQNASSEIISDNLVNELKFEFGANLTVERNDT